MYKLVDFIMANIDRQMVENALRYFSRDLVLQSRNVFTKLYQWQNGSKDLNIKLPLPKVY